MTLKPPDVEHPELSVVMVTHGAWPLTERAVAALDAHTQRPFELIVVDNASADETVAQLSQLRNTLLIRNEQNLGFGPGTNQGAEHARGEYLVLLNSDAFVHPGWLEPLLEVLAQPTVGAVVPRYLHRDGKLQEAGALLAQDGTVCLYGDGDDPDRACYRFRRTIDYGSAVCMLIRRATFAAVGGLDESYAPAYYEDVDLCMRLAQRGMSVVYEPRSTVTHVRYGSGGIDAAIELSERNRRLFVERWGDRLAGRPASFVKASDQAVILARDALTTPRLLVCASPGEPGVKELAAALLEGWSHTRLTWFMQTERGDGSGTDQRLALGVEILDQQDAAWLSDRLFHYDAVVRGATTSAQLMAAVDQTQPQAPQIQLNELAGPPEFLRSRLVPVLAGAGIAPPSPP
jgi:GT2 family glycosyltransferase